ncbi:MAG: hypothetical protein IJS60_00800 [Abditibacteriota bacterium]|nr:hypothetical protein [Abditibacteriota bacterium]
MKYLNLKNNPLNLEYTLNSGQAFRWNKIEDKWFGFIKNSPCLIWTEKDSLYWIGEQCEKDIKNYFCLNIDYNIIYKEIINADKDIEALIDQYFGLRILRQDPEETFYSFLCSACNAIPKIMIGIEKFCALFPKNEVIFEDKTVYSFPTTAQISKGNREDMRAIKEIAFRGRNIYDCSQILIDKPGFFENLTTIKYEKAKEKLTNIKNIGPKIADCICLFSLNMPFVVPVDTHVRQIAEKKWGYKTKSKSISKTDYKEIQDLFTDKYGNNSGLAQQFLFMDEI